MIPGQFFEFLKCLSSFSVPSWSSGLHTAPPGTQPEGDPRHCEENSMMSNKIGEEGQEGSAHFKREGKVLVKGAGEWPTGEKQGFLGAPEGAGWLGFELG